MAKKVRKLTFQDRVTYDPTKWNNNHKEKDYNLKITEPGQAISVKKLVERYEKGNRGQWKVDGPTDRDWETLVSLLF